MRFSLKPDVLALSECVAHPGGIPAPLHRTNLNLEITNWTTSARTTNFSGEFLLSFASPTPVGTVVAYEPGDVSYLEGGSWKALSPGPDKGRKLQVIPVPPGVHIEAFKFVVPAQPTGTNVSSGPAKEFRATLPFVTLVSIRLANLATYARANASSTNSPSGAAALIDGNVDAERNFSTGVSSQESISFEWDQPQSFRGFAFFHGRLDDGLRQMRIEVEETNGWKAVIGRSTSVGLFRNNQFFASMEQLNSRRVRMVRSSEGRISLGEVAFLANLGTAPPPEAPVVFTEKTWMIPKVAREQVKVDGQTNDWSVPPTNGFNLAFDEQAFHVMYQARGGDAAFANSGTNVNELFHTGDAIDIQLQTQPRLDPRRSGPGPGDLRLIISEFEKQPVCVLYEYRSDDLLILPVTFKADSGSVICDKVTRLTNALVRIERKEGELTLEASIPWKLLSTTPALLRETRGDVGRIFGVKSATVVGRRAYWSNPVTSAPSDIAVAADLQPRLWSVLRFKDSAER
jgi:hypothetical protein